LLLERRQHNSDGVDALEESYQSSSSAILDQSSQEQTVSKGILKGHVQNLEKEITSLRADLQQAEEEINEEKKRVAENSARYQDIQLEQEALIRSLKQALDSANKQLNCFSNKPPYWDSPAALSPIVDKTSLHADAFYKMDAFYPPKVSPLMQGKALPSTPLGRGRNNLYMPLGGTVSPRVALKEGLSSTRGIEPCDHFDTEGGGFDAKLVSSYDLKSGALSNGQKLPHTDSCASLGFDEENFDLSLNESAGTQQVPAGKSVQPLKTPNSSPPANHLYSSVNAEESFDLLENYYGRVLNADDCTHECLTEVLYEQHGKGYNG